MNELSRLRLYKTSAEGEHKILLEELAKRRLGQKSLRKKLKKMELRLFESQQNDDMSDYVDNRESMRKRPFSHSGIIKASFEKTGSETENAKETMNGQQKKKRPQSGLSAVSFQETDCSNIKVNVEQGDTSNKPASSRKRPQSGYSSVSFQDSVSDAAEEINSSIGLKRRPQSGYSAVSFQETICVTDIEQSNDQSHRLASSVIMSSEEADSESSG